ncbi:UNVERIFIED_CONTAM: hypothetical protein PYX00_003829 [Menopon gallinae]|uniref:PH domain-containing protein n=1 Tax=Menopon gallinae TaxID=328185 RepID=A0AAW2I2T0_9NEOP
MSSSFASVGNVEMKRLHHDSTSSSHEIGSKNSTPVSRTPEKKSRRTSLQVLLPKLPSSESINHGSTSPSVLTPSSAVEHFKMSDSVLNEKSPNSASKLTRKESYKAQRKCYRQEKKRVADELLNSLKDPSVIVLADWLKVRGTLKSWTKLWCILKPGLLLLYKSPKIKSNHWVGTVLLNACQVMERPSKKDGFCFKLFHPMEQSIWAPRGPEKETIGAVVQPLPTSYLIFRAPSQAAGKCWLDALELSVRCSTLLVRSLSRPGHEHTPDHDVTANHDTQWSEADFEKHFADPDGDSDPGGDHNSGVEQLSVSDTESENSAKCEEQVEQPEEEEIPEIQYIVKEEGEIGSQGEQVEELAEENKSLIWFLVKQVRPGMDLSKVVLPTFILEPRSFLDKLSDSYYHADILSKAVLEDDAFTRMKTVVKWYLSGFYKKPKGLKKPYNPILGETFRCYWKHPNGSRTFYIAEQVSHHPPISSFYVTNRQDGFSISGSILAKSKFYGNSTSAILDGVAILTLLPRGEEYTVTIPYALCKGIVMGTLTMELGGKVAIECEKTGYKTELEFKLKPLIGGSDHINGICGKLKLGKETLATIDGYWDGIINIKDKRTGEEQELWNPTPVVKASRLKRYTVPVELQGDFESERLWGKVSAAILADDQTAATEEKTILEDAQRAAAKKRKETNTDWIPRYFEQSLISGAWVYKHCDLRPWDPRNDVQQYEYNYIICTKTRHRTPMIRTSSIVSVEPSNVQPLLQTESRSSLSVLKSSKRRITSKTKRQESISSSQDGELHSDSSQWEKSSAVSRPKIDVKILEKVKCVEQTLKQNSDRIVKLQQSLETVAKMQREREKALQQKYGGVFHTETLIIIAIISVLQLILVYIFFKKG